MGFLADLRFGARTLRRAPGFALAAVVTLGLGIGATTAIYSVVYGVLLKPLAFKAPDRIATVNTKFLRERSREIPRVTGGDLLDLREQRAIFQSFATYAGGEMGVQVAGHAEFNGVYLVDHEFFDVLGVTPLAGRVFTDAEAGRMALVSLGFAQRNFGGAAEAVGKTLSFDNRVFEIAGVLPGGFQFPRKTEVWVSRQLKVENTNRSAYNYRAIVRLKDGVSFSQANERLEALGASLEASFPKDNQGKRFSVTMLQEQLVSSVRGTLYWLLSAVGLLLLIACANVANLLLARSSGRSREIAVRSAVGASRFRILRQLLAESLILAAGGGLLGVVVATWGTALLISLAPENLPRLSEVRISIPVLLFAGLVALGSSVVFGLVPAIQTSKLDVVTALRKGARNLAGGSASFTRSAVVIGEIALSFCLVLAAGSLFKNLIQLASVELGFRTEKLLVMYAHRPVRTNDEALKSTRFFDELYGELARIPGVQSVAGAMGMPIGRYGSNGFYETEGRPPEGDGARQHAGFRLASPGYFSTLGMRLVKGRDFAFSDQFDTPFVAIISESLARVSFPDVDPIGRKIRCGLDSDKWMTIVGLVSDVRSNTPGEPAGQELYMPLTQHPWHANEIQVLLRTTPEPSTLIASVRELVARRDPNVATQFTTMEQTVSDSIATPRFRTFLTAAFAACALLLAMAGIYGVMSYLAAQRTPEFGIRISLGARTGDVAWIVFSRALVLALIGLLLGAALAYAGMRVAASQIPGIQAADIADIAVAVTALLATTLIAALLPAWRASRVSPMEALRAD